MKKIFLFILVFTTFVFYGQFYSFKGNLGNIPITMHVLVTPIGFWGSYYYDEVKLPIMLINWRGSLKSNKWKLYGQIGNITEEFDGVFDGNTFSGTWKNDRKKLSFVLKRNTSFEQHYKTYQSYDSAKYYKFSASIVYPLASHPYFSLIEKNIFDGSITNFFKNLEIQKAENFAQWKKDFSEDVVFSIPEDITMIYPIYSSSKFMVFAIYSYMNMGGAHGWGGFSYAVLSTQLNQIITVDNILPVQQSALNNKLIAEIKELYEDLDIDEFPLNEADICMTDGGIIFSLPAGIIGPYSWGDITVYLSRKDAEPLLNSFARSLWSNQ